MTDKDIWFAHWQTLCTYCHALDGAACKIQQWDENIMIMPGPLEVFGHGSAVSTAARE